MSAKNESASGESQPEVVEAAKTPVEIGEARATAAKEWLKNRGEAVTRMAEKGGNFLKKIGYGLLASDKVLERGGKAVADKASEGYQYVSEKTIAAAEAAGTRLNEGWTNTQKTTEKIWNSGKERCVAICDRGTEIRNGLIDRIKDKARLAEIKKIEKSLADMKKESSKIEDMSRLNRITINKLEKMLEMEAKGA